MRISILGGVILVIVAALLGLFTLIIYDYASSTVHEERLLVIDTMFDAGQTSVGYTGAGRDGGVVVTSTPDEYKFLAEWPDGRRDLVNTNKVSWVQLDHGVEYKFHCRYGGFTKSLISCLR